MSRDVKRREGQLPEKKRPDWLAGLAATALFLLHLGMAVLGMAMTIAALAVPVMLVLALLRWLFGAGQ